MAEAVTAIWGKHVKCHRKALRTPAGCLHTLDDHQARARIIRSTSMYMCDRTRRRESPTTQNDPTQIKLTELTERVEHVWIERSLTYLLKPI